MFVALDDMVDDLTRFVELDAQHWNSDEGFFRFNDVTLFYRKLPDTVQFECDGIVIEAERFDFIPE